jgi:hypothetical protein
MHGFISKLCSVNTVFNYYNFVIYFEIKKYISSNFVILQCCFVPHLVYSSQWIFLFLRKVSLGFWQTVPWIVDCFSYQESMYRRLLFHGMFCVPVGPVDRIVFVKALFPLLPSDWLVYPPLKVTYWSILQVLCCYLLLHLILSKSASLHVFRSLQVWWIKFIIVMSSWQISTFIFM